MALEDDDSGIGYEDLLADQTKKDKAGPKRDYLGRNLIYRGDRLNLTQMDPTIKRLEFGFGWDVVGFGDEGADLDASVFLLDKDDLTRVDEDFVFYNNEEGCDGAVKHKGDNRTGAGAGDDENIYLELTGVPFDVFKIEVVVSIYNGDENEKSFAKDVRNTFIRLHNPDSEMELFRYELDKEMTENPDATAIKVGFLERMGPEWHFQAEGIAVRGGLEKIATEYGIIVKAVLSSRDNDLSHKEEDSGSV